ncbi:PEP-CTERM sorting domain-containing protein [Futiania mangrovi]|uniref:PEP-CTERM sorting domain-containing protein n=1 Tax=Futiania mangrovi TaxID=2959716 RepID=A0A9J6PAM4_9PROT|nr:PEP-CTERM sorting domain-containing protein [Futiania mangrovii]MCP1335110.1 PEP-CTERM sorting domain-containing protein [Futiania mangrovii]
MKKIFGAFALSAGLLVASMAHATVLVDEDFTAATISQATLTPTQNLNMWLDLPSAPARWGITSGAECVAPCDGDYARHLNPPTGDHTNLLYYGISSAVVPAGATQLQLTFDFIKQEPPTTDGTAYILGLTAAGSVSPFAPWFSGPDVVVLASLSLYSDVWTSSTPMIADLDGKYAAYAIAFQMRGTAADGGVRGIDNVNLQAIPEPAGLAMIGIGLLGLAAAARRKAHAAA